MSVLNAASSILSSSRMTIARSALRWCLRSWRGLARSTAVSVEEVSDLLPKLSIRIDEQIKQAGFLIPFAVRIASATGYSYGSGARRL
jgi:hypothetical protein